MRLVRFVTVDAWEVVVNPSMVIRVRNAEQTEEGYATCILDMAHAREGQHREIRVRGSLEFVQHELDIGFREFYPS